MHENGNFLPRLISWNLTFSCNLRCPHCYIDASESAGARGGERRRGEKTGREKKGRGERRRGENAGGGEAGAGELSTAEGKELIDQIAEVSKPILILSGGEPLLRDDLFELAHYAAKEKGLTVGLGTNGTLISDSVARDLKSCGVSAVAVSLDSSSPERHDAFRGVKGAWKRALEGIAACRRNGIAVQVNTTVTQQNYGEIYEIMKLAERVGATAFHLFFLVPTGRGVKMKDISAEKYEQMLAEVLQKVAAGKTKLALRPVCAPQFMRIALQQKGLDLKKRRWTRGCLAGLTYCRIYPTGEVTPCPYLPLKVGSVRETHFKEIWFNSPVLKSLRDFDNLKGKCGVCEYRAVCGGCRARAYGLTSFVDVCGGLQEPAELSGDFLAEEPWCPYIPLGREEGEEGERGERGDKN